MVYYSVILVLTNRFLFYLFKKFDEHPFDISMSYKISESIEVRLIH